MSRTYKDRPWQIGGRINQTHINKNVKAEAKKNRKEFKKLKEAMPAHWLKKFLANRWRWD